MERTAAQDLQPLLLCPELELYILSFLVPNNKKYFRIRCKGNVRVRNRTIANACLVCRAWFAFVIELLPASFVIVHLLPRSIEKDWHVVLGYALMGEFRWKIRNAEKDLGARMVRESLSRALHESARRGNQYVSKLLLKECKAYLRDSVYDTSYHTAFRYG